jgi:hypothetical protein
MSSSGRALYHLINLPQRTFESLFEVMSILLLLCCSSTFTTILLLKFCPLLDHWKIVAKLPTGHLLLLIKSLLNILSHIDVQTVVILCLYLVSFRIDHFNSLLNLSFVFVSICSIMFTAWAKFCPLNVYYLKLFCILKVFFYLQFIVYYYLKCVYTMNIFLLSPQQMLLMSLFTRL